jgi:hypothetical protein
VKKNEFNRRMWDNRKRIKWKRISLRERKRNSTRECGIIGK